MKKRVLRELGKIFTHEQHKVEKPEIIPFEEGAVTLDGQHVKVKRKKKKERG
jgi:hypothetical protein